MILKLHVKLRTIHNSRKKKKNVTTDVIPLNYTEKIIILGKNNDEWQKKLFLYAENFVSNYESKLK